MARPLRIDDDGLISHVTGRSHAHAPAFPDADARDRFVAILVTVVERYGWEIVALTVLTTHYHLLVRTPSACLSDGMRVLQSTYAAWLNRRRDTRGPVWGDRFHSRPIRSPRHLLAASVYIDANAPAAGLVADPSDWPWSSFAANAGLATPAPWHRPALLDEVAGTDRSGYADLVQARCRRNA